MRFLKLLVMLIGCVCASGVLPAAPASAGVRWDHVVVDLSEQHVRVYDANGRVLRYWAASTGAPSTPTPIGRFRVTSKSATTFVTDDPSVTMTHMVRFRGGVGFHSIPRKNGKPMRSPLGLKPVSHGCVRLADANAKELFAHLAIGSLVIVQR